LGKSNSSTGALIFVAQKMMQDWLKNNKAPQLQRKQIAYTAALLNEINFETGHIHDMVSRIILHVPP
jgi:hypothetical protein